MEAQVSMNLAQRILKVYKKVKSVEKNEEVETGKNRSYTAVSHDDVTALLHDAVADAGIIILPDMVECEISTFDIQKNDYTQKWYMAKVKVTAEFINTDNPTDIKLKSAYAYALDTSDKATNKAYSMALKAIYLKVFMLESRDNEEQRTFDSDNPNNQSQVPRFGNNPAPRPTPTVSTFGGSPKPAASAPFQAPQQPVNQTAAIMANNPPPSPDPTFNYGYNTPAVDDDPNSFANFDNKINFQGGKKE